MTDEDSKLSRRSFMGRSAVVVGGADRGTGGAGGVRTSGVASTAPRVAAPSAASPAAAVSGRIRGRAVGARPPRHRAAGVTSAFGVPLPADAAPKEQQYTLGTISSAGQGWRAMDALESIYASGPVYNSLNEPLVRVDKDWQVIPGQAEKWEVSPDGLSWTFTLEKGLIWTNGDEVTADDYVASFQYAADPKHAWDFTWYYDGIIKNFGEAARGKVPTTDVGVQAARTSTRSSSRPSEAGPVPARDADLVGAAPRQVAGEVRLRRLQHRPEDRRHLRPVHARGVQPRPARGLGREHELHRARSSRLIDKLVANIVTGGSDFARYQAARSTASRASRSATSRPSWPTRAQDAVQRQPGRLPLLLRLLRRHQEAVRRQEGAPGVRQGDRSRGDRQGHPRADGGAGLHLAHAGLPGRERGRAQADPGLRPRRGEEAAGRRRLPGRPGLPEADADRPRRRPGLPRRPSPRRSSPASPRRWASRSTSRPWTRPRS